MDNTKIKIGSLIVRNGYHWYGKVTYIQSDDRIEVLWNMSISEKLSGAKIEHQLESLTKLGWKVISDEKEILQFLLKCDYT